MILSVSGIKKSFIPQEVLKNVSFHLEEKEKMALIGINGAGKTTLFQIILGKQLPDEGEVYLRKDAKIGYLPQVAEYDSNNKIQDELLSVFAPLIAMEAKMREMEQEMQYRSDQEFLDRYAKLMHDFEKQDGYQYRSRVRGVMTGLGFSEEEFELPIPLLSGGQKTRVMLAKLLLQSPDLLLLDEPTNHLDIEALSWLEGYLTGFKGALIIISHDRYFLDRICTKTVELEAGISSVYNGNYTFFIEQKQFRKKIALRAYEQQQQEIKRQEGIISELRGRGMEKFIKRAQSREKILDKMEVLEKPQELNATMHLHFTPSIQSGEIVLTAQKVAKTFDQKPLFQDVDFEIRRGEKVALIGPNGIGKTTLFKMILNQESVTYGDLHPGVNVRPGYYEQTQENLSPDKSILYEIYDTYPNLTIPEIRNILGAFLFRGDDVFKEIKTLSGGEKARVSLCKIMLSSCNFLLLDEPTNHLDIASREILEQNLRQYEGTLLFISHDRYFINQVATRIIELRPDGAVVYLGDYDFYLEHKRQEIQEVITQAPTKSKIDFTEQKLDQRKIRQKKTRIRRLEELIDENEKEIEEIKQKMLMPKYYSSASAFSELEFRVHKLEQENETAMEEWDLLNNELSEEEN